MVWGGIQQRDFVYIDDVALFNRLCVEADGLGCSVYNVSTGLGTSIRDLADRVCATFDLGEPIYEEVAEGQSSEIVKGRMRLPAELQVMILDNRKGTGGSKLVSRSCLGPGDRFGNGMVAKPTVAVAGNALLGFIPMCGQDGNFNSR